MRLREVAIFTKRVDSVARFYERLLGAAPTHRSSGMAVFEAGDVQILIHVRHSPRPDELPCENHVAFEVDDLDRAVADAEQRGLTMAFPARKYEWGYSAYLRDPEGHLLELHETSH